MTPIYVYITRPYAYEVYMGGDRNLMVWLDQPDYSHHSMGRDDVRGRLTYVDIGWRTAFQQHGVRAKDLISQDPSLRDAIMDHVFLSVCPKGMNMEEGIAWANSPDPNSNSQFNDYKYRTLFYDDSWEAKCNTSFKRFLLRVNLRDSTVERIVPRVYLRRLTTNDPITDDREEITDKISEYFALEREHPAPGPDDIPF